MPNYSFRSLEDGSEFTIEMTIAERDVYVEKNKDKYIQIFTKAVGLGDSVSLGYVKPDQGFRDVLREVKKHHPRGGGVNTF